MNNNINNTENNLIINNFDNLIIIKNARGFPINLNCD